MACAPKPYARGDVRLPTGTHKLRCTYCRWCLLCGACLLFADVGWGAVGWGSRPLPGKARLVKFYERMVRHLAPCTPASYVIRSAMHTYCSLTRKPGMYIDARGLS
jgi:hypothetical protein